MLVRVYDMGVEALSNGKRTCSIVSKSGVVRQNMLPFRRSYAAGRKRRIVQVAKGRFECDGFVRESLMLGIGHMGEQGCAKKDIGRE